MDTHHEDTSACSPLANPAWDADRLVVVGLVEGIQRVVHQVDHEDGIDLAEEASDLRWKGKLAGRFCTGFSVLDYCEVSRYSIKKKKHH